MNSGLKGLIASLVILTSHWAMAESYFLKYDDGALVGEVCFFFQERAQEIGFDLNEVQFDFAPNHQNAPPFPVLKPASDKNIDEHSLLLRVLPSFCRLAHKAQVQLNEKDGPKTEEDRFRLHLTGALLLNLRIMKDEYEKIHRKLAARNLRQRFPVALDNPGLYMTKSGEYLMANRLDLINFMDELHYTYGREALEALDLDNPIVKNGSGEKALYYTE